MSGQTKLKDAVPFKIFASELIDRRSKKPRRKDRKEEKLSARQMGICHDCSLPIAWRENYIVRPEVWAAAEMPPHGGYLHLACLETRIGRELETADFLVVYVGEDSAAMNMQVLDLASYLRFNDVMGC